MATDPDSASLCGSCVGGCCKRYDEVDVAAADVKRIAGHLGVPVEDVMADMTMKLASGGRGVKKTRERWCIFHSPRVGCMIYEARPDTCRAYLPPQCLEDHVFHAKPTVKLADIMKLAEENR